jgi:hypothetical protein
MIRTHRFSTIGLIVCLVCAPWSGTLFASEQSFSSKEDPASASTVSNTPEAAEATSVRPTSNAPASTADVSPGLLSTLERSRFTLSDGALTSPAPLESIGAPPVWRSAGAFGSVESGTFEQRRWGRGRGRNGASETAIIFGAAAAIAGTAVLVYANRPDCNTDPTASGCGYGTKVVGGAVLSAGIVGVVVGALTWR